MAMLASLIRWWEPLLLAAAVLAVVFEKRLIVFERKVASTIVRVFGKDARSMRANMNDECGRTQFAPTEEDKQ